MKQTLKISLLISLLIFGLASLWHFVFAWIIKDYAAIIFPVNESPWEHVKLFFFPAIIGYLIEYLIYGKKLKNFLFVHSVSLLLMPIVMFILFYGYRSFGIAESLTIDIIITFIVIVAASYIAHNLSFSNKSIKGAKYITIMIPLLLFALYSVFTFYTPKGEMFAHPESGEYGILHHEDYLGHDH